MDYQPEPLETSAIQISAELEPLLEELATNTHEVWSKNRINEGWSNGPKRDDDQKHHPGLVPYEELSESERDYDRETSLQILKLILAKGYKITKG